jgi:hypothetical protein
MRLELFSDLRSDIAVWRRLPIRHTIGHTNQYGASPEFRAQAEAMAQMWLSLDVFDEQFSDWAADESEKSRRA